MPQGATFAGAMLPVLMSACAYAATVYALGPAGPGVLVLAVFAWYAFPGFLLARVAVAPEPASVPARIFGALWCYALSTIVLLVLWVAGVRNAPALVVAPPLAGGALLFILLRVTGPLSLPARIAGD